LLYGDLKYVADNLGGVEMIKFGSGRKIIERLRA